MIAVAGLATVLLDILTLVKAGFELQSIVQKVREMEEAGVSQEEISKHIRTMRDEALSDLKKALE